MGQLSTSWHKWSKHCRENFWKKYENQIRNFSITIRNHHELPKVAEVRRRAPDLPPVLDVPWNHEHGAGQDSLPESMQTLQRYISTFVNVINHLLLSDIVEAA
jgi:hypothetical protein